jgi:hypothetical protein
MTNIAKSLPIDTHSTATFGRTFDGTLPSPGATRPENSLASMAGAQPPADVCAVAPNAKAGAEIAGTAQSRTPGSARDGPTIGRDQSPPAPLADTAKDVATVLSLPARAPACPRVRDARRSCAGRTLRKNVDCRRASFDHRNTRPYGEWYFDKCRKTLAKAEKIPDGRDGCFWPLRDLRASDSPRRMVRKKVGAPSDVLREFLGSMVPRNSRPPIGDADAAEVYFPEGRFLSVAQIGVTPMHRRKSLWVKTPDSRLGAWLFPLPERLSMQCTHE